jgi:hypothetical protein
VVLRGISVVTVELAVKPHTKTLIRPFWKSVLGGEPQNPKGLLEVVGMNPSHKSSKR